VENHLARFVRQEVGDAAGHSPDDERHDEQERNQDAQGGDAAAQQGGQAGREEGYQGEVARELHDSIGHALTVAVVQAGAARAAGDPDFTDRALDAIEDTGRAALEDLERVLGVLRESEQPASRRPTLAEADRLLESARASGAKVDAEVTGALETVPGPVSREGYRILQESLTNVLRHAGSVPVRVRIAVEDQTLALEVRNPLTAEIPGPGRGSGLRGIRERAALLGGRARTGPDDGDWQVHVGLPLR